MKIQNIKITLIVLAGLLVLSFSVFVSAQDNNGAQNIFLDSDQDGLTDAEEKLYGTDSHKKDTDGDGYSDGVEINSGYDPLKPAPGDRIVPEKIKNQTENKDANKKNITRKVAEKITSLTSNTTSANQTVTLEQIQEISNEAVNQVITEDDLPEVTDDEIIIKEQDFKNLTNKQIEEKKKEDFLNYIVAIFYILSSNSPKPLTSTSAIQSVATTMTGEISTALATRDSETFDELGENAEKMLEEIKEIEVPQDLVELHKKGLRFFKYALSLPEDLVSNEEDPIADMTQYSKLQAFLDVLMNYNSEVESKFNEFNINYDDVIKGKIINLGIEAPDLSDSDTLINSDETNEDDAEADNETEE